MKKRIFSLFVCAALLMCSAVGCGKEEGTAGDGSAAGYQTMEPPEDGWTIEELLSVTYLCDTQLSYPLTLGVLGEEFSLDTDSAIEMSSVVSVPILYQNENVFSISYLSANKVKNITEELPIDCLNLQAYHSEISNSIIINGISFNESTKNVLMALGEPDNDYENNSVWTYQFKNDNSTKLTLSFDSDRLNTISLDYINGKN